MPLAGHSASAFASCASTLTAFPSRCSRPSTSSSEALAQSGAPLGYVVKPGTASGGGYRLTGVTWQVRGTASGGGYRLAAPVSPTGTGTPCCCNYLPCVLR